MITRFLLTIALGKYIATGEFGIYGLVQSSLAIGLYLIGLDLYVFTNREIPKRDLEGQQTVLSRFAMKWRLTPSDTSIHL